MNTAAGTGIYPCMTRGVSNKIHDLTNEITRCK